MRRTAAAIALTNGPWPLHPCWSWHQRSTASQHLTEKREIYARMEAQEYWRLDRRGEYYGEILVGEHLVDGSYERFELYTEANGDAWSKSEALGVDFVFLVEGGLGRFLHRASATGEWLNTLGAERSARHAEANCQADGSLGLAVAHAQQERQLRQAARTQAECDQH